jgi:hypothetical protein
MTDRDDRDLRERFAALRDEDATGLPPLARVLRGHDARPPARRPRLIPVAALTLAAAGTAFVLLLKPHGAEPSIEDAIAEAQSMSAWTAPTDEWLTLSDLEIPDSVPSLSLSSVTLPDEDAGPNPPTATPQGESR